MLLVKFEKTIQVNEDEWRNVWIEKVFEGSATLNEIVEWAKEEQYVARIHSLSEMQWNAQKLDVRGLIITEI